VFNPQPNALPPVTQPDSVPGSPPAGPLAFNRLPPVSACFPRAQPNSFRINCRLFASLSVSFSRFVRLPRLGRLNRLPYPLHPVNPFLSFFYKFTG